MKCSAHQQLFLETSNSYVCMFLISWFLSHCCISNVSSWSRCLLWCFMTLKQLYKCHNMSPSLLIALLPSRFKFVRTLDYCDDGECRAVVDTGQSVGGQVPTGELRWRVRVRCWTFKIIGSTGLNIYNIINVYIYIRIYSKENLSWRYLGHNDNFHAFTGVFHHVECGWSMMECQALHCWPCLKTLQSNFSRRALAPRAPTQSFPRRSFRHKNVSWLVSWIVMIMTGFTLVSHWLPHWLPWFDSFEVTWHIFDRYLTHCLARTSKQPWQIRPPVPVEVHDFYHEIRDELSTAHGRCEGFPLWWRWMKVLKVVREHQMLKVRCLTLHVLRCFDFAWRFWRFWRFWRLSVKMKAVALSSRT